MVWFGAAPCLQLPYQVSTERLRDVLKKPRWDRKFLYLAMEGPLAGLGNCVLLFWGLVAGFEGPSPPNRKPSSSCQETLMLHAREPVVWLVRKN